MTRQEAKELLYIIQSFAESKIKPETKYRPFKNQEECKELYLTI